MVSTVLLAVAIPLAVLLACALAVIAFLQLYSSRNGKCHHHRSASPDPVIESPDPVIESPDPVIETPPPLKRFLAYHTGRLEFGFGRTMYLTQFVARYAEFRKPTEDTEERIAELLFREKPTKGHGAPYFPNLHGFTPLEICNSLCGGYGRDLMLNHIMLQIVFSSVMLNTDSNFEYSMLPLLPHDLERLAQIQQQNRFAERHEHSTPKMIEFCRSHYLKAETDEILWKRVNRDGYLDLFESLISPHLKTDTADEVETRRIILHKLFDDAVAFGMSSIMVEYGREVEVTWGERDDRGVSAITWSPTLREVYWKTAPVMGSGLMCLQYPLPKSTDFVYAEGIPKFWSVIQPAQKREPDPNVVVPEWKSADTWVRDHIAATDMLKKSHESGGEQNGSMEGTSTPVEV